MHAHRRCISPKKIVTVGRSEILSLFVHKQKNDYRQTDNDIGQADQQARWQMDGQQSRWADGHIYALY